MMKRILGALLALAFVQLSIAQAQQAVPMPAGQWCLNAAGTAWVAAGGPSNNCTSAGSGTSANLYLPNNYATPLTVTSTSSQLTLPTGTSITVYNIGTVPAYVKIGTGGVTATTANDVVQPGSWIGFAPGANTTLAAITVSGTTTLNVSAGTGNPVGTGGTANNAASTDGATWSVGVTPFMPGGGTYNASISNLANGAQGTFALSINRSLHVFDDNSANLLAAAQAPAQGQATTATPAYSNATAGNLSLDLAGGLRNSSYQPNGNYATLNATSSTGNVALPSGTTVVVNNTSAINAAYINFGTSNSVTATTSQIVLQPLSWRSFTVGANTWIAAITASSTANLIIEGGAGEPAGGANGTVSTLTSNVANPTSTLTMTSSPSLSSSSTRRTRSLDICEICRSPSVPGRISTKAPNSTILRTFPR